MEGIGRLDPRLRTLFDSEGDGAAPLRYAACSGAAAMGKGMDEVRVLLHFNGSIEPAKAAGFKPSSIAGDVAAGSASLVDLAVIAALDSVTRIESSRPLVSELDISIKETTADQLHFAEPPLSGSGVLIGLIDSGIDYTHGCFRAEDGATRILAIWDQNLLAVTGESSPRNFTYGVEYSRETINQALQLSATADEKVRHKDTRGHGTLVAGIAAGNGLASGFAIGLSGAKREIKERNINDEQAVGTYVGVAPQADLLVVAYDTEGTIGESAAMQDAVKYLLDKAESLQRPIVINISQGDFIGPHDGSSLLERGIDQLLGKPGQIIVKAAGNARGCNAHASGTVSAGGMVCLPLTVPESDKRRDTIDIWYAGADRFDVAIQQQDERVTNFVSPGPCGVTLSLPNGNRVYLVSSTADPANSDNRIYIEIQPGSRPTICPGEWAIWLKGVVVEQGLFHAWIDRSTDPAPQFVGEFVSDDYTLSIPGTSKKIITVGSYITRIPDSDGALNGQLAPYSSFGPTRDGRAKPEIVAPGEAIISALSGAKGKRQYFLMGGTSMSAPHVTGAAALLLEKNPSLTQDEIRELLCRHARTDSHTGSPPDKGWGQGKLDVAAAYRNMELCAAHHVEPHVQEAASEIVCATVDAQH
jgi:subtilisin family serine protease